jgi:predicted transglutaminase-like cysteine proteinase
MQFATPMSPKNVLALGPEDFLASRRLAVRKTTFDQAWNKARRANLPSSMVRKLDFATRGQSLQSKLSAVNAWANTRVNYVEDRDLYRRNDYWASAGETIRAGAGDCEDIAIVKMQLLASMGVDRSDMYLTVARDLSRNADHAILIVKSGDKHYMLDNSTNEVLDASQSYDYRPILSFSLNKKWLHGY